MTDQPDDRRIDDLRQQLRALGYLDAGVDRFVLGPARSARHHLTIAALASLRVGLMAAVLLGPATAVGIGARLPGLVTGPRDAIVVALYLGAIFGIAAVIFAFVVSAVFARLAGATTVQRARAMSRAAGSIVSVACLLYLTFWWRSANAGLAWQSPAWTAFALLIAVLISMLIGHAVSITTFAVSMALHPVGDVQDASRGSSRRLMIAAGALAFCGAAVLLLLTAPAGPAAVDTPPLAVVSPGIRVMLIAIDGFDPEVYESLQSTGKVPALARVFGGSTARFVADDAGDPARAWTTIATGQPADVHGVHALETLRVAGVHGAVASGESGGIARAVRVTTDVLRLTRPSIASGAELRAKPLWEVAADAGLRASVVNWWATWPAGTSGPHAPIVISDRASLRLERGGALDAEIAPPELYERLRRDWPSIKSESSQFVSSALASSGDPASDALLRRSAELDAAQVKLLSRITTTTSDLTAVYLQGLDVAQHTLLAPVAGASPSAIGARLDALRGYYIFLDALLTPLVEPEKQELVIVVTEPGRLSSKTHGLIAMTGGVAATHASATLNPVDVAPTVLHALGVPVSRELAGKPATALFSTEFVARYPVREVTTYGSRTASAVRRSGDPLDQEAIERLRSLGYVR